jgi:formylglycine-generating enzyme
VDSGNNAYRHKDAYYFLPSEDEWYKAAYHQNDGVTANYWDYATGSNTIPTAVASGTTSGTAVFNGQSDPADVNLAGGLSPYGTMGQNGNVWEWNESAFDGVNNLTDEGRGIRGGSWGNSEDPLRSSNRANLPPTFEFADIGFRVASIPEPSSIVMLLFAASALLLRRRFSL